ncbi:MAG: hypothetical protein O2820_12930 [Planctomycetota bacterium]|nr:hypothetical protein [Planctomycetota bacterium]MDA1250117.1 hypothetical protein [Planctomycetota bacterium]
MSFLQKFAKNSHRDGPTRSASSFEHVDAEELETHLRIARYGSFVLTDAVRPSYDLQVVPQAGFRHDSYKDNDTGIEIPVVMGAASKHVLLDLFLDLLDPMGDVVNVVIETSHECEHGGHKDLVREGIDLPILKSILYDYEDLLLDDGCTGIAVLNPSIPYEVQFDEHKLLIAYGSNLAEFERIFGEYGVHCHEDIRFITEAEHVHSSTEDFTERFEQLKYDLGIDC